MPGMLNTTIMVDSKKEKLNTFEIVHASIVDAGNTQVPLPAQMAGIVTELSQPDSKVIQFGNTLFVAHLASDREAFVRAFNADTAQNFLENIGKFSTYLYKDLGIDIITIPGLEDPNLARLLSAFFSRPIRPGMQYHITESQPPMAIAQLGTPRD
tara:strand:- start:393 stop:857 length:465 start_codon:yes stop_codon:yes gene_type:complete